MTANSSKTATRPSQTKGSAKRSNKAAERSKAQRGNFDGSVDAIKLLTDDHKEVQALFKAYQKLVDDDGEDDLREQLAQDICGKLTVHATI